MKKFVILSALMALVLPFALSAQEVDSKSVEVKSIAASAEGFLASCNRCASKCESKPKLKCAPKKKYAPKPKPKCAPKKQCERKPRCKSAPRCASKSKCQS